jgi:iron complex outermembrane receptor protein
MKSRNGFASLALGIIAAASTGLPAPAVAQQSATASGPTLEEVVVTARKTEETLLDAPLAITAFSAEDIEKQGFKTLEDVALRTPGVQYSQQGGQIPGRFTSAIRFRGMNVNSDSPSLQLGALFLDGVFVLGGTQSIPYDDIERIEVIKGPQAALYGRSTFGGAINYITRTPSLSEYSGQVSALGANYGEADVSGSFEGPIVTDKLAFRVGGRYYTRGALFNASDGGGLGEESSKSAQLTLFWKPVDALEVRLRGFHNQDEDGPSTGGLVQGWRNDTCTGQRISTEDPAFPVAQPMNYVCGEVPEQGAAIAANGSRNIIDTVTSLYAPQAALNGTPRFLIDNLVNRPNPAVLDVPTIDHVGLIRTVTRFSLQASYEFGGGYELSGQAGWNELKANWIRSFGLTPLGYWWSRDPQDSEDESYELRISSPADSKFTWLAGVNYYEQTFLQSGSGGDAVWFCLSSVVRPVGSPCAVAPMATGTNFFTANSLAQNTDQVETQGVFASLNYDFTDQWSLSIEARYQKDETRKAILTATPTVIEETNTLPRGILRWRPTEASNVYLSWAKGVLPPVVNSEVANATPREAAQYAAIPPGPAGVVPGDELDMYELGWKQEWMDRRAQTSIALYYGEWQNQKGRAAFQIQEDCGSFAHGGVGGATAANGCPNGPTGLPAVFPSGAPFLNTRNANVPGDSTLQGVEFEGSALITDRWDVRGTLTWAKSEYDDFFFNFVQPIAGFTQMKGNSNARFPEWSGSLFTGYTAPLPSSDWSWYVNGDLNYVGETFVDESNLAECSDYVLANARLGAEKDGLRIEGFIRNLTDDDSWAACARWTDFDSAPSLAQLTQFQGVAVTPQVPRQYGLRVVVSF